MAVMTAREMIRKEYGGSKNFMTPNVVRVGKIHTDLAYEISSGSGFEPGSMIYGVSIVQQTGPSSTERRTDISTVFHRLRDAEAYVDSLRAGQYRRGRQGAGGRDAAAFQRAERARLARRARRRR